MNKSTSCPICSLNHFITNCPLHTSKSLQQQLTLVSKHKLCYNCLGPHIASSCRVTKRCQKCGHKYHSTIHQAKVKSSISDSTQTKSENINTTTSQPSEKQVLLHSKFATHSMSSCVLLATSQVMVVTDNENSIKVRVLLDQGSLVISVVTERIIQLLRLPQKSSSILLIGLGAFKTNKTRGLTTLKLTPHYNNNVACVISSYILSKFSHFTG